jgi:hypothetical protein
MIEQHVIRNINFIAYPKEWISDEPALISLVDSNKHICG